MMERWRWRRWPLRLLVPAVGVMVVFTSAAAVRAEPVTTVGWIRHHAVPLHTIDPAAPLDDLALLRWSVGDAEIVGLGESVHGTAEETVLKHRTLRFLVERMGFRTVAWEDDWTTGVQIDRYIRTGEGDLDTLVGQMAFQWKSRETKDVLRWLREYNAEHADKVRFFGVEYYLTWRPAYDGVDSYVAKTAPDRLGELRDHLEPLRPDPTHTDVYQHIAWYQEQEDKQFYIRHAHQVQDLVERLPHVPGDSAHAVAVHHARQIVSFYEHFALPDAEALVYREARGAENLKWWRDLSGDKIAYWAGSPHTVNAPALHIVRPDADDMRFASAGSYLRRWYGKRYRSIGFTFAHGTASLGGGQTVYLPPPKAGWFERPFGRVKYEQFALDLRAPAPPPVRRWLHSPVTTRGLADSGPDGYMTGGTLAEWFDVIVHRQEVTPVRPA